MALIDKEANQQRHSNPFYNDYCFDDKADSAEEVEPWEKPYITDNILDTSAEVSLNIPTVEAYVPVLSVTHAQCFTAIATC